MTARRHRLRLRGRGRARRAPPHQRPRGRGSRGRPGVAPRHGPPLPPGLTPRGPAARTRPPTCRTPGGAQRDPPPTRRGEARAAVGNERHAAPPRGRRTRLPPLPAEGGGVLLCPRAPAVATVATAALGRGGGWGVRYPKAPSRIAREGVLTEGAPSLPRTVSPSGSRRRSTSRPASAGREGSAVQGSGPPHRSVCAVRARAEPASRPLQGLIRRGLRDEGNGHASPFRLDPPERQPRSGHTRHRGGDPRGTPG